MAKDKIGGARMPVIEEGLVTIMQTQERIINLQAACLTLVENRKDISAHGKLNLCQIILNTIGLDALLDLISFIDTCIEQPDGTLCT